MVVNVVLFTIRSALMVEKFMVLISSSVYKVQEEEVELTGPVLLYPLIMLRKILVITTPLWLLILIEGDVLVSDTIIIVM